MYNIYNIKYSKNNINYKASQSINNNAIVHTYGSKLILIRSYNSKKYITKYVNRKANINSIFCLSLYLTSSYEQSIKIVKKNKYRSPLEIILSKKKKIKKLIDTNEISLFDISICIIGSVSKQEVLQYTEDLEIISGDDECIVVESKSLLENINLTKQKFDDYVNRRNEALDQKEMNQRIDALYNEYVKLSSIEEIIKTTNKIYCILLDNEY